MLKRRLEPQSLAWQPYRLELHHPPLHRQPWMWYDTFCGRVNMVCSLWHIHICFSYQWFAEIDNMLSWGTGCQTRCSLLHFSLFYWKSINYVNEWDNSPINPIGSHHIHKRTTLVPSKLMTWRPTARLTNGLHLQNIIIHPLAPCVAVQSRTAAIAWSWRRSAGFRWRPPIFPRPPSRSPPPLSHPSLTPPAAG